VKAVTYRIVQFYDASVDIIEEMNDHEARSKAMPLPVSFKTSS